MVTASNLHVHDNVIKRVSGSTGFGISLEAYGDYENCHVHHNDITNGLVVVGPGGTWTSGWTYRKISIDNNILHGYGINIEGRTSGDYTNSIHDISITNNQIKNPWTFGIYAEKIADTLNINNNWIRDTNQSNTAGSNFDGIFLIDCSNFIVHDNWIHMADNSASTRNPHGIAWYNDINGRIYNNHVVNNTTNQSFRDHGNSSGVFLELPALRTISRKRGSYNVFAAGAIGDGILNASGVFVADVGAGGGLGFTEAGNPVTAFRFASTGTTSGTVVGLRFGSDVFSRRTNASLTTKFLIDNTSGVRGFIGFVSASTSGSSFLAATADPLSGRTGIGLSIDSASSANFRVVRNAGTASGTHTNFGINGASTTALDTSIHTLTIQSDETNSRFRFIWDNAPNNYTTVIPASSTAMGFATFVSNPGVGTARLMYIGDLSIEANG